MIKDDLHIFYYYFLLVKANFLQSGTILLPELFNEYEELVDEARMVGMTEFVDALQELSGMYVVQKALHLQTSSWKKKLINNCNAIES